VLREPRKSKIAEEDWVKKKWSKAQREWGGEGHGGLGKNFVIRERSHGPGGDWKNERIAEELG